MAESAKVKIRKGWFKGLGRDGDRTVEDQMTGLEKLVAEVAGKTVLDAGCAEGLISIELAKAGAKSCHGLEIVERFVDIANRLADENKVLCTFEAANLNEYRLVGQPQSDIVLALAILHKLQDPSRVCGELADLAKNLMVIRLPPSGLRIVDERSGRVPHEIGDVMGAKGFTLETETTGHLGEWIGYFRRPAKAAAAPAPAPAPPPPAPAPAPVAAPAPAETKPAQSETEPAPSVTSAPDSGTNAPASETPKLDAGVADTKDPTPSITEPVGVDPADGKVETGGRLFPTEAAGRGRRVRGDSK